MSKNGISGRILSLSFTFVLCLSFLFSPFVQPAEGANVGVDHGVRPAGFPPQTDFPFLRVIETTAEGIVVEFAPPAVAFETSTLDGGECQRVTIPGLPQTDDPGLPSLPVQGAMLGIPQESQPTLQILSADWVALPGAHRLCIAPQPVLTRSSARDGRVPPLELSGYTTAANPSTLIDAFLPATSAELTSTGNLRSQHFAEIRFNPLQTNPVTGELRYYRKIQVALNFNLSKSDGGAGAPVSLPLATSSEGPFEENLRSALLNYAEARAWRAAGTAFAGTAGAAAQRCCGTRCSPSEQYRGHPKPANV